MLVSTGGCCSRREEGTYTSTMEMMIERRR